MHRFYRLKQENNVNDQLWTDIKNMMRNCTVTPLNHSTKPRRSISTRSTATKVFDKLSRIVSVKHWRNDEATYLVLLTSYCSFFIQKKLFHYKTNFVWYEIGACCSFILSSTIADSLERNDLN